MTGSDIPRRAPWRSLTIGILVLLLVGTNGWWAWNALDAGVSAAYTEDSLRDNSEALAQSLAAIEAAGRPGATRQSIIAAALAAGDGAEPFEKDGHVWVGGIGLAFDADGRLTGAETSWSPR